MFFINGAIKGTDLFYRHSTKSFVPLNERWVEYLISLSETSEGKGVPISERINTRRQLNLSAIVNPPDVMGSRKYASVEVIDPAEVKALAATAWESMKQAATAVLTDPEPQESILRKFITQDGGFSAIQKIAAAAKNEPEFAQALFLCSSAENYMPELEPTKAAAPTPALTLHLDAHKNANVKSASATDRAKGYVFEDCREKSALNEAVYEATDRSLRSVTEPGIYEVLTSDGSFREMLCAYHKHVIEPEYGGNVCCSSAPVSALLPFALVDLGDHKTKDLDLCLPAVKVLGKFIRDIKADDGVAVPAAVKMYRIYNLHSKSLSEPVYVDKAAKKDLGLTQVTVRNHWSDKTMVWTLNPDYDKADFRSKVLGGCCVWIEVKSETNAPYAGSDFKYHHVDDSIELGDPAALEDFIYNHGFAKAAVQKHKDEYLIRLHAEQRNTPGVFMNQLMTKAALMVHCALDEATADGVLEKIAACEGRPYLFHYEPAEKKAHNLRFPQFPEFYDTMNSDYNVSQQPAPSHMMIQAEHTKPYIEKHRIGDVQRFDAADNSDNGIDTATPMELYQMSQQRGVGSLFEHGVVGALTNTFDSAALVETYMPDLQTALDRIGRVLFLFYWKPEDFATAFGSDDQTQLENKLGDQCHTWNILMLPTGHSQSGHDSVG